MFEMDNASVRLGDWLVFAGLNLRVAPGEIVSVLGPSGCGKTTLLRAMCGLEALETGTRRLDQTPLLDRTIHPEITMLFQKPVLYPHLNVTQNIALGAPTTMSKADMAARITNVLTSVGLEGFERRAQRPSRG